MSTQLLSIRMATAKAMLPHKFSATDIKSATINTSLQYHLHSTETPVFGNDYKVGGVRSSKK